MDWPASTRRVNLTVGQHHVTSDPNEELVTLLGSCVSACIRDPMNGVGGMNHFLLPGDPQQARNPAGDSLRYGAFAMEQLLNDIISHGGNRGRLEVKLFGAASLMKSGMQIGAWNASFAREFMAREGLPVVAEDLGGTRARRIHFFPATGRVMRLSIGALREPEVFGAENRFVENLRRHQIAGDVELFE
jgi:chemotaxis protein CheD